ncbi:MAG: ECF-type sigma factor [Acidobacteriota bacterium]
MNPDNETTLLLRQWTGGDERAANELFDRLYDDIHALAGRARRRGPAGAPRATALVHELYLRLVAQKRAQWKNRSHFFAIASRILRRIVVDEARALWAEKRGGGVQKISLAELGDVGLSGRPAEILAVEACLQELERQSPERARLVELRFFAGLSLEETAEVLGQSRATTVRQWRVTKGWLSRELENGPPPLSSPD